MRSVWGVVLLLLVAATLRFWRLGEPPKQFFDEIYYARTAQEYLTGQPLYEWTHPPLSKLLLAGSVRVFGFTPWGWRFASALAGVLAIAVLHALGCAVFQDSRKGFVVGVLGTVDSLLLVESRIAKPEIFLLLFCTAAYAAWWTGLRTRRPGWYLVAALCAGAAAATKWTGLTSVGILLVASLLALRRGELPAPGLNFAALLLLPAVPYAASYLPHLLRGESLADLLRLHENMYRYHSTLVATHPYASRWWTWPLLLRPMWYHYEVQSGIMTGIFAVGNPAVWWAILPAVGLVARRALSTGPWRDVFILLGFLSSYLPYAFIGRLLFIYHMLPALPFAYLAIAEALEGVEERVGKEWVRAYLLLATTIFAFQLPVLVAYPVPARWLRWWIWMPTWV
ncbi:MAG: phospholipid carrier-dependent glycosyltransferase [Armatimonadota bacterium]|nr:phospholipid carrier-dependent glycosyltransferase [Armatimonadota bacterium]MDR7568377.1 phospholipid carrier-dependent glycosyltransferase [Armatimonadota bacterium]MDR7601029.1 phospholipid carrier-dependent glycosyltransferase [Armatimonadota bacterium]